ncbi:HK97 family phage prohead protease [Paracidovorax wautersii]|uniref:HK97 family phage prohead protease n=1 Tax=Paracidovorax wautersii TaxID=1177982 RepID=A0ABU1IG32_9BURK|nr:HK97 family phage prohead protease [Paracidovorax wautersii]MDR6216181.1 HK97 family phage prohead protease [Paracidovorax wautersii]
MERAYSTLVIKALSDEGGKRTFKGIASTPSTDRTGDIVEPKGAVFKLPIPFLWQHDNGDPIGWITAARVTEKGIEVEGEVAQIDEDGPLKERLTTAWQMLKAKLVRGLSVGLKPLEAARIEGTYGMRYTKWLWFELSAVTVPANADASITTIKSLDNALLAATGHKQDRVVRLLPPGVSGQPQARKGVVYLNP